MKSSRWWKGGAMLLALAISGPAQLFAQQFELPIPMASDSSQVGAGNPAIRTQATHLQFCNQPQPGMPGALNFTGDGIDLEGQHYLLRDICAVPGLQRETPVGLTLLRDFALENMGSRGAIGTLEPLDGFCPEPLSVTIAPGVTISLTIDCRLGKNKESRQSDVCDVRSEAVAGEGASLLDPLTPPLVAGVLGSCQESVSPYQPKRYPITVKSNQDPERLLNFPAGSLSFLSGIQWWPKLFGLERAFYDDVITYDWADHFGRGFMTAAYDPFKVSQGVEGVLDLDGPGPLDAELIVSSDLPPMFEFGYSSPVVFYRKNFDPSIGALKLSGYLTGQWPPYGTPLSSDNLYHLWVQNFNPIAVEPMRIFKRRGFAVVNQATYGFDLGQYFLIAGRPYVDVDPVTGTPVAVRWGAFLQCPSLTVPGEFTNCMSILHHTKFSFVTFWEESAPEGEPLAPWGAIPDVDRLNPNAVFGPLYQQMVPGGAMGLDERLDAPVSLLCPAVFDAVVAKEEIEGAWGRWKYSLVVPCGERGGTELDGDGERDTYLYKANPFNDRLHFRLSLAADPVPTHITIPKAYRVSSPAGFVPYGIDVGEVGGDACPDYLLTFRGQETVDFVELPDAFENALGQNVVFQVNDGDRHMFADVVQVHFGRMNDDESDCLINVDPNLSFTHPWAQFATAKFADVDGPDPFTGISTIDVVVGNLVPEQIPTDGGPGGGQFTAYAYVYYGANSAAAPERIRMGFMTDTFGPAPGDADAAAGYVRALAEAGDDALDPGEGLFGVAALTTDSHGSSGSHLGAINGLPLALPPFGCPKKENVEVASPPDLIWALVQNNQAIDLGLEPALVNEDGVLIPSTCYDEHICELSVGGVDVPLPFWGEEDACCDNPCTAICRAFLCNSEDLIGNDWWCDATLDDDDDVCDLFGGGGMPGGGGGGGGGAAPAMCADMFSGADGTTIDLEFLDADNVCCIKDCTDSGLEACRTFCVDVDAPGTPMDDLCDLVLACPVAGGAGAKNDDDKAEGDGKTEFARFRPDEVHHSRAPWIADMRDLQPAAMKTVQGSSKQSVSPEAQEAFQKFNKGFEDVLKKSQGTYEGFYLKYLNDYLFKPKKAIKKAPTPKKQKLSSWLWDLIVPSAYADCVDRPDTYIDECCDGTEDADFRSCSDFSDDQALTCCPDAPPDWRTCCLSNHCGFLIVEGGGPVCTTADPDPGPGPGGGGPGPGPGGGGPGPGPGGGMAPSVPRLPRGQVMPGKREITVVVNKRAVEIPPDIPPGCSEGVRPIPAGLECTLHEQCGEGNFCGIDCECRDIPGDDPDPHFCGMGPLDAGEQCNRDNACALGQICDINCQCVAGPTTPPIGPVGPISPPVGEPPAGPVASISSNDQCVWRVKGFSSDEARKLYTNLSDELRAIDKISSDHFAEREYSSVEAVCCFAGGAAPNLAPDQLNLSLSGQPRPGMEGNFRPYAIIQDRGPALEDFTASIWKTTEPHVIDEATLILPTSTGPNLSVTGDEFLPDLAAPELFSERVVPMTSQYAVNAVTLASRMTVINNVLSHRAQAVGAGQSLSLSSDFSVQLPGTATPTNQVGIDPQLAQAGAGYACHVVSFKIAPDRASVFGIAGGGEADKQWYIENRQFDFDALKAELQARCQAKEIAGQPCTADELKGLPWDAYSTYQFTVVQEKYGLALSDAEQGSASVTVFTGRPHGVSGSGGCHCDLAASAPPTAGFVLLMLIALVPFGGLVLVRFGRSHPFLSSRALKGRGDLLP